MQSHSAPLKRRGEALQREALAIITGDILLSRRYEQLLSIPGIAQTSAIQLLACLSLLPPELDKRQWVACAGLDPAPRESGQSTQPRRISRRGSPRLRRALFMPALVAARCNPPLRAYYERLLAKGKKPLLALSALMVKLLHIIWATWNSASSMTPPNPSPTQLDAQESISQSDLLFPRAPGRRARHHRRAAAHPLPGAGLRATARREAGKLAAHP